MPDGFVVGPRARDAVDLVELLATFLAARIEFVPPMRLETSVPETERRIRRPGGQEVGEVGGVIGWTDPLRGGLELAGLIWAARQLPRLAVDLAGHARAPAFAREAHVIALRGQGLGVGLERGREIAPVVGRRFELPGIAAGQDAGARRRAFGVGRVGVGEQHPLMGHAVEPGRPHPRTAIRPHVRPGGIIGDAEQDVGTCRFPGGSGPQRLPGGPSQRCSHCLQEGSPRYSCLLHRSRPLSHVTLDSRCPTDQALYLPAAGPIHDTAIRPFGKQVTAGGPASAGIDRFVQQSQTQNGPALRFSLLGSGQGLTAISGSGEIHFLRQIHATWQVIGGRVKVEEV